jgi:LEA14-like dessication related protein
MKYPSLLFLAIAFLGLLILSSCRTPKDLEFKSLKNFSIDNVGFSATNIKVDVEYYNPNNFGLELSRTDFDLFVDEQFLGHSTQELQVKIPKRNLFIVPLVIALDMKNLLKNGLTVLANKEVTIKVVGKVKVGKAGVYKSFPLTYQTKQRLSIF